MRIQVIVIFVFILLIPYKNFGQEVSINAKVKVKKNHYTFTINLKNNGKAHLHATKRYKSLRYCSSKKYDPCGIDTLDFISNESGRKLNYDSLFPDVPVKEYKIGDPQPERMPHDFKDGSPPVCQFENLNAKHTNKYCVKVKRVKGCNSPVIVIRAYDFLKDGGEGVKYNIRILPDGEKKVSITEVKYKTLIYR